MAFMPIFFKYPSESATSLYFLDDKKSRVNRNQSPWPNVIVSGIALLIVGFWRFTSHDARTFPFVWVLFGGIHGSKAILKARRNRRLRRAGTEVAKVFD